MAKKSGPIRGLSGTAFLDSADFYLQNVNYRKKLEKICEKYGIAPRLQPGPEHVLMWAEIGAALAEQYEGVGKSGKGRRKGTAGKAAKDGYMADEDIVRMFEGVAEELGLSFDAVLKKCVDQAEQQEKIEWREDPGANLKRLQRVKKQLDKQRLLEEQQKKLGLLFGIFDADKK